MTPAEVIANHLESHQWRGEPWASHSSHNFNSSCKVCSGDVDALAEQAVAALVAAGLVVVSAEDLRVALNMLSYTNLPKRNGKSALLRLNAALPERTETDA